MDIELFNLRTLEYRPLQRVVKSPLYKVSILLGQLVIIWGLMLSPFVLASFLFKLLGLE